MTTLTIVPRHWYSWDFDLTDGNRPLAGLEMSRWREKGVLTVDGVDHRVYREGLMSGEFILERDGVVLARATKPSAFRNAFELNFGGWKYTLRKKSMWSRSFVVEGGEREIGSLVPKSMWSRRARVTLPPDWPLPVRAFVIWLTLILWKREYDAAGSSA
jgi:hypothetical protein